MHRLSEQISTAMFAKITLLFGGIGTAVALFASALPINELPNVEPHTALDTLLVAMGAWMIRQNQMPKEEKHKEGLSSVVLKKLDELTAGISKAGEELTNHRIDFAKFSSRVEENLENVGERVNRIENKVFNGGIRA